MTDTDDALELSKPLTLTDPLAVDRSRTVDDDGTVTIDVGEQYAGETVDVGVSRAGDAPRTDGGESLTHPKLDDDLPARPEYETDAEAAVDDALVNLFLVARDGGDTYHHELAANLLGSHRLDAGKTLLADGGQSVDGGTTVPEVSDTRRQKEREEIGDHAQIEGLTRGTIIEYDEWQWVVVTEVATDEDPTMVGFVVVDKLGDSITRTLESAWGCWEHYNAIKAYRDSDHERWTDVDYITGDDIWTTLGPIHPDARSEEATAGETLVTDGGVPDLDSLAVDELLLVSNPDYPEVWFYELVDGDIRRYHSQFGYEGDSVPTREEVHSSITSEATDVTVVDRETLREHQRQTLATDGGQPRNPVDARLAARPPSPIEQAKEAAFDDPTRRELTNMLYGLSCVVGCLVDGEDESWRPTTITVEFDREDYGRGADDVLTIMRRAGWELQSVTFGRPQLHFERVDQRRAGETEVIETYRAQKDAMGDSKIEELFMRLQDERNRRTSRQRREERETDE